MSKASPDRRARLPGRPALDWLAHHPQGARMLQTARELLAIQSALAAVLPPALARHMRVARVDGPQITVVVPGPAHAARLRQLTAGAAEHLNTAGWPIHRILIRIDAAMGRGATQTAIREAEPLGEAALRSFEALGREVAPGPLADAIGRLLRHHRG